MYKILQRSKDEESNTEIRLAEIDNGYSIGVFDLDVQEYYPQLIIFKKHDLEKAKQRFEDIVKKAQGDTK
jgi:hypothetical protein